MGRWVWQSGFIPQPQKTKRGLFQKELKAKNYLERSPCLSRSFEKNIWWLLRKENIYMVILQNKITFSRVLTTFTSGPIYLLYYADFFICSFKLYFLSCLQQVPFNITFYASPVVLVSVRHQYDRQVKGTIPPENNIITSWVEVEYFRCPFDHLIL